MISSFFLAILVINFTTIRQCSRPIVVTKNGSVEGIKLKSTSGRQFYAFLSIPYAEAPVGQLRFQPPVPHADWTDVLECTHDGPFCPQIFSLFNVGNEDCLTVNVYTPLLPTELRYNISLPVMVYIHGGGYAEGGAASSLYGPQRILNKDIVLVTFQYRLGALGFLSTEDSAASGNFGLLDQNLALRWVQTNIIFFSGDPQRVTIFGASAGGSSVTYHMLSNVSRGLFRAAISEGGTALTPSSIQRHPLKWAQKLGQLFDCPTTNGTTRLVHCLRSVPASDLVEKTHTEFNGYTMLNLVFMPVVENDQTGRFIVESAESLLRKGDFTKVPFLAGVNKHEGIVTYVESPTIYDKIDEAYFDVTLPQILRNITCYERNLDRVAYAIKTEYYDPIDVHNRSQVIRTAIDLNSDCYRKAPNDATVRWIIAGGQPVYMYVFNYVGRHSLSTYDGERMVDHGDELGYLFKMAWDILPLDDRDQAISNLLVDMWTNFASEEKPTLTGSKVHWLPTSSSSSSANGIKYLQIDDAENLTMKTNYLESRMYFWNVVVSNIVNNGSSVVTSK